MRTNGTRQYLQNDFAHNITQVGLGHINQSNIGVSVTHKLIILKKKKAHEIMFLIKLKSKFPMPTALISTKTMYTLGLEYIYNFGYSRIQS